MEMIYGRKQPQSLAAEFWLVRHGESEVNVKLDEVYRGANTWSELTESAKEQARCLGKTWLERGVGFDAWLCSPTVRTQQTSRYIQEGMDIAWPRFDLVMELIELGQGNAEGNSKTNFRPAVGPPACKPARTLERGKSTDEEFWYSALHDLQTCRVRGAESQAEVYERSRRCLEDFVFRMGGLMQPQLGRASIRVAVFTHENVIKCLVLGLGLSIEPYLKLSYKNLSVTKISVRGNRPWEWQLLGNE